MDGEEDAESEIPPKYSHDFVLHKLQRVNFYEVAFFKYIFGSQVAIIKSQMPQYKCVLYSNFSDMHYNGSNNRSNLNCLIHPKALFSRRDF